MATILTFPCLSCTAYFSAIKLLAVLIAFILNAPANPRFDETTITNTLFGSRSSIKGEELPSRLDERFPKISFSLVA
ncbi:hypothetical protein D9M68_509670 [compost metagenome]